MMQLGFGKYALESLEWIIHNDPQYLVWYMYQNQFRNAELDKELADLNFKLSPVVNFGKFKDWSLADIRYNHPSYYKWLSNHADIRQKHPIIDRWIQLN
jgi:hypothetical protein